MRLQQLTPLLLLNALSAPVLADVTLSFPSNVDMLVIDEQKPTVKSSFFDSESTVTLDNGVHQIVFRVQQSFPQGGDKELFTSQPVIATFFAEDNALVLTVPTFKSSRQARSFNDNAQWQLIDQHNKSLEVTQDRMRHDGMQLGRNFIAESQAYNQKGLVAAWSSSLSTEELVAPTAVNTTSSASVLNEEANTAEEMLNFWYQKADPETQKRFRDSINDQAVKN